LEKQHKYKQVTLKVFSLGYLINHAGKLEREIDDNFIQRKVQQ